MNACSSQGATWRRSWKSVTAIVSIAVLARSPAASAEQPTTIPSAAIEAWSRQADALNRFTGTMVKEHTTDAPGGESVTVSRRLRFGTNANGAFLEEEHEGRSAVGAVNSEYGFAATKGPSDDGLVLQQIRRGTLIQQVDREVRDAFEPFLFSGFEIMGKQMQDLVASDHFVLRSLSRDEGAQTTTIDFEYNLPDELKTKDTAIRGGVITFDEARDWLIRSFKCTTFWGEKEGTVEYRDMDGVHVPARYETHSNASGGNGSVTESTKYELISIEPLPLGTERIRLEDYGITPTGQITPLREERPFRTTLLVVNVVLMALLLMGYYALRRRKSRQPPNTP